MERLTSKDIAHLLLLACLALAAQVVYSFSTSPLYDAADFDQDIFETIGWQWSLGELPYVAVWDHKGPIIFFFNMLGYLFGGKPGILFIDVVIEIGMVAAVYLFVSRRSTRLFGFLTALFTLFAHITVGSGGNQVGDYSLLFLLAATFLFYQYTLGLTRGRYDHRPLYALVYGLGFGACLMSRLSDGFALCLMVLSVCIVLVVHRLWLNLLANAAAFVVGAAIIVVPFSIYFYLHGALADMWYATLTFNIEYAMTSHISDTVHGLSKWVYRAVYFSPVICVMVSSVATIIYDRRRQAEAWPWILVSLGTIVWVFKSYANANYAIPTIPLLVVAALQIRQLEIERKSLRYVMLGMVIMVFGCFANHNRVFLTYFTPAAPIYPEIMASAPQSYKQSFVAYNCVPYINKQLDVKPACRFFVNQDWFIQNGASIRPKIRQAFAEGHAQWVLIKDYEQSNIADILSRRYTIYTSRPDLGLTLFRLKQ